MSEIWAFQSSEGLGGRNSSRYRPGASSTICCPLRADLVQDAHLIVGAPGVELGLDRLVVTAGTAAQQSARDRDPGDVSVPVEQQIPNVCRSRHVRQQTRGRFADDLGVQRDSAIREIYRLATLPHGGVEFALRRNEIRHIRNGIADVITLVVAGQMHRLVEVHRTRWVKSPKGQARQIWQLRKWLCSSVFSLFDDVWREFSRHRQLGSDLREPARQRADRRVLIILTVLRSVLAVRYTHGCSRRGNMEADMARWHALT